MPRVAITPVTPSRAGVTAAVAVAGSVADGNTIANDGKTFLLATNTNGSATARTIDFVVKRTVDGITPDKAAVSIAAGATKAFGPFPTNDYGVSLDFNVEHAEVTVAAYRMP